jgi:Polysaccharide deacetylase/Domain of unknown function (DUF4157)
MIRVHSPRQPEARRVSYEERPRTAGQALTAGDQRALGRAMGADPSHVRVHADERAAEQAADRGAAAFTVGSHIYLGRPAACDLRGGVTRIVLHEVAHALQQQHARPAVGGARIHHEGAEHEAGLVAATLQWGARRGDYSRVAGAEVPTATALPPAAAGVRVRLSEEGAQLVQLTYDDGPDTAGNTQRVLDELNRAGARATFYLVGQRVQEGENWRIVFDIAAAGHWIGNHAFDWNNATDNHIFLHGSSNERARKILITEWAIRDALRRGKADATSRNAWTSIPQDRRDYIDDVIVRGTGRFRTPGFRSHWYRADDWTTAGAIGICNRILAGAGLRQFAVSDDVDIDPEDWRRGRTQAEVEQGVTGALSSPSQSILLHSRIAATAAATPTIVSAIQQRGPAGFRPPAQGVSSPEHEASVLAEQQERSRWIFEPTPRGETGTIRPSAGFANLRSISNPPTHGEILQARRFLLNHLDAGPLLLGYTAMGIFQLAQLAGPNEVREFRRELETTEGPPGHGYVLNFLYENPEFRLFYEFLRNVDQPFPHGPGVTY